MLQEFINGLNELAGMVGYTVIIGALIYAGVKLATRGKD